VAGLGTHVYATVELLFAFLRAGGDWIEAALARWSDGEDVSLAASALVDVLGQNSAFIAGSGVAGPLAGVVTARKLSATDAIA